MTQNVSQEHEFSITKKTTPSFVKKHFLYTIILVCLLGIGVFFLLTHFSDLLYARLSPYVIVFTIAISGVFSGIMIYRKLQKLEDFLRAMSYPLGYEEEYFDQEIPYLSDDAKDFFRDPQMTSKQDARYLSQEMMKAVSQQIASLRAYAHGVVFVGFILSLWFVLSGFFLNKFDHTDFFGHVVQNLSILVAAMMAGGLVLFFEWRLGCLLQKMEWLLQNQFTQRVRFVTPAFNHDPHMNLVYQALLKVENHLEKLQERFFISGNDNYHQDYLAHVQKAVTDSLIPFEKNYQELKQALATNHADMIQTTDHLEKIFPTESLTKIHACVDRIEISLNDLQRKHQEESLSNRAVLALQEEAQKIDLNIQSFSEKQKNHQDYLQDLKEMLSQELQKIKIDRQKPVVFMPIDTPIAQMHTPIHHDH